MEGRGDDDLGVHQFLVEPAVLPFLVARRHERVPLLLEPLADAQLVLGRAEERGLLARVVVAIVEDEEYLDLRSEKRCVSLANAELQKYRIWRLVLIPPAQMWQRKVAWRQGWAAVPDEKCGAERGCGVDQRRRCGQALGEGENAGRNERAMTIPLWKEL